MPHPLRSGSMAQHEAIAARHLNNSPVTPPSPNIEQLVRGEAMRWHPPHSSSLQQRDTDYEPTPQQKKSVLAKVKEKAKKWGRSLSSKKKHNDDSVNNNGNTTPSWGVSLDDEDDDEPECLGPPMYESEVASGRYKNVTTVRPRQHHPAISSAPSVLEKQLSSGKVATKMHIAESIAAGKQPQVSPVTLAQTLKEKPSPPPPPQSPESTQVIASKIHNVNVSTSSSSSSTSPFSAATAGTIKAAAPSSAPAAAASVTWKHPPAEVSSSSSTTAPNRSAAPGPLKLEEAAPAPVATKPADSSEANAEQRRAYSAPAPGKGAALDTGRTNSEQIWDKGVSVKEYIMNKLEPGEDAKALSRVISQAMSPRKAPGDAGVVEKVKEVVSSLWQEDSESASSDSASQSASQSSYHPMYSTPSSPHIPVSTNSTEVEEENQGRILQAN
ncbi:hypothetical protein LINGRAHAP2_LOCUS26482 [Linum grandiflorum]